MKRQKIGLFSAIMLALNSLIGSGWLFGSGSAAKIAGPAAILSWILGAVIIIAIALTYVELGAMFPESGGMSRYAQYSHGPLLGFVAAWAVGVVFLGYFVELLIDRRVDSFLVSLQGIPGVLPPVFTMILLGYFLITAYDDFKWTIQNGISRKTLWWGRLIALALATIGIWVVNNLLSLFDHPLASWQAMGMQLLVLLSSTLIFQMIGNGFGLLNRTWKWIVGIGLPILFIIFLVALIRAMMSLNIGYQHNEWIGPNSALWTILSSSSTWWIIWGITMVIVIFLSKFFNDKMQLRRD